MVSGRAGVGNLTCGSIWNCITVHAVVGYAGFLYRLPLGRWRLVPPKRPMATWRSGYAAVCKTVYPGSIPGVASIT